MVSNPFSDLSVRVSANTRDFESGIDDARDSLSGLAGMASAVMTPLQALQNRANEARDEFSSLDRAVGGATRSLSGLAAVAGGTAAALGALSTTTSGLSSSLGSLTISLTGSIALFGALGAAATGLVSTLVPLAAVLGTLTAGAGALAAAFGAVVGSGLLAFGEARGEQNQQRLQEVQARIAELEALQETTGGLTAAQQEELETLEEQADTLEEQTGIMGGLESAFADLRDELAPIITEFGEQFIPLIDQAINFLPVLVQNVVDAIGGLDAFVAVIRDLGAQAFRVIPDLVGGLFDLARRALPMLMDGIQFLSQNAGGLFEGMLQTTRVLGPTLLNLGNAIIAALPSLNRLGTMILQTVVPAFTGLINLISDVISIGSGSGSFAEFLTTLVRNGLEWLRGPGRQILMSAGNFIIGTLTELISPSGGGQDGILSAFIDRLESILDGVETWLNQGGQQQITNFLTTLFDTVSAGINENSESFTSKVVDPLTGILSGVFRAIANALASDEANELSRTINQTVENALGFAIESIANYITSDAFVSDMELLGDALANVFAGAIKGSIFQAVKMASPAVLIGSEIIQALGGGPSESDAAATTPSPSPSAGNVTQATQQNRQSLNSLKSSENIEVVVEGDTDVVKEVSAQTVREQQRRQERMQNR